VSTFKDFDRRILAALDAPATKENLRFLQAWAACEGGNARNNPFNTTLRLAGSTPYNRAGVQHFPDPLAGLAATLLTLRLSYYRPLVAALVAGNHDAERITELGAAALKTWGTGTSCILGTLRASHGRS
jgi:hypothetical protein